MVADARSWSTGTRSATARSSTASPAPATAGTSCGATPTRIRADYRRSIEYTLGTLISYVQTYGDDNLVLVFLGDHQPAAVGHR